MDVRFVTPSSSNNAVDMSEFLSLTNSSPTPPLMHTLQPLLPNATPADADLGIMSSDLEALSAVDVSKPDLLISSSSVGQESSFITMQSSYGNAAEFNMSSVSSVDYPSDDSQYYVQPKLETDTKLGSTPDAIQSAVTTLSSQLSSSASPHLAADLLTGPDNFVMPAAQTFTNFPPAGVVDVSAPPKKPLSPYMRFSKGIWQKVKAANPSLSVCQVGATIGRMWREMSDVNKQHFNDDFALDKMRYDSEMQHYLIANGLQVSGVSKSKKKKDNKEKPPVASTSSNPAPTPTSVMLTPEQMAEEMARTILESAGICADPAMLSSLAVDQSLCDDQLPSFSQVWSGTETIAPAQLCLTSDQSFSGAGTTLPQSIVPSAGSQPTALASLAGDNQLFAAGDMVSNQLLAAGDDATSWLWQQYTTDAQSMGVINQTANGAASLATVGSLNDFVMTMDTQLEPGEIRPTVSIPSQPSDAGLATSWPSAGRDAAELTLLRNALVARGKEAARLTRELELAYKLIEQLQQQNIAYQQLEWNLQQTTIDQVQQQQQVENNVGLIISNGIN